MISSLRKAKSIKSIQILHFRFSYLRPFITSTLKQFTNKPNELNSENFIKSESASYIEQLYNKWKKNKSEIDPSWDEYFTKLELSGTGFPSEQPIIAEPEKHPILETIYDTYSSYFNQEEMANINSLIRAYQRSGYLNANLDPLGLDLLDRPILNDELDRLRSTLDYKTYDFTVKDLSREFIINNQHIIKGIFGEKRTIKLKEILEYLNKAYCNTIGADFMYISSIAETDFIREKFEVEWVNYKASKDEQLKTLNNIAAAVLFEEFLNKKFTTNERFSLEGMESLISGLNTFIDKLVENGVKDLSIGMPHRGRINVLANVLGKSLSTIFAEFQDKITIIPEDTPKDDEIGYDISGDVKYHLGTFNTLRYPNDKAISIDLLANPSHLEAIDPVVVGKVRAKQHFHNDIERNKYVGLLIHGDASFAGQGITYESLQMSNLKNFGVGGIIHVIINNQIGFTTPPNEGRSTHFVTDLLKTYESPVLHVNCEDPLAINFAFSMAVEYRMKFKKDIAIDLIGYRRHGHNEFDQPFFTQPQMYKIISKKENILSIFKNKVVSDGSLNIQEAENIINSVISIIEKSYKDAENNQYEKSNWVSIKWPNINPKKYSPPHYTGVKLEKLRALNEKINILPSNYKLHHTINKIYNQRYLKIKEGKDIDIPTAEALCWATLLDEGYTVRFSGQDAQRGGFSHRHSVLHDQEEKKEYIPLRIICKNNQNNFQPCNSPLSEYAVCGFELGFSYYNPDALVIWEAQYGDFANGAQIIIDQFLTGGEKKWNIESGIVLNLPHGMDGQGPEHSSARIERFLQMIEDEEEDEALSPSEIKNNNGKTIQIQKSNYQVCYPTLSSNYFHLMRRQLKREFRKPLILILSKKLLKHRMAYSRIEEFDEKTMFIKVRAESNRNILANPEKVKTVFLCSGQIFVDLLQTREKYNRTDIAIVILEQIGPFPYREIYEAIEPFKNSKFVWVQEEHSNQGAWDYVKHRMIKLFKCLGFKNQELKYVGRKTSAVASTGFRWIFQQEHEEIIKDAFES